MESHKLFENLGANTSQESGLETELDRPSVPEPEQTIERAEYAVEAENLSMPELTQALADLTKEHTERRAQAIERILKLRGRN